MANKEKQTATQNAFGGVAIPEIFRSVSNVDLIGNYNDGKADDKSLISEIRNKRMNQGLALVLRGISQVIEYRNSTFLAQVISKAKLSPLEKNVIAVVLPNAGYSASRGKVLFEEVTTLPENCEMSNAACVNVKAWAELVSSVRAGHDAKGIPTSHDPQSDGFKEYFKREKTDEEKSEAAEKSLMKAIGNGFIDRDTLAKILADMPKESA